MTPTIEQAAPATTAKTASLETMPISASGRHPKSTTAKEINDFSMAPRKFPMAQS